MADPVAPPEVVYLRARVRREQARVTKLEAALRGLLHNMQQHNCPGCHIEKAREALED